ncbi:MULTISPECIES: NACHT domain-containing protein [unclassified Streptomyces]|uniref:NACHT domain-containing protein n=1 Tax=unclassified Streptomyces TaxID=2593676 RepID=UPI00344F3036
MTPSAAQLADRTVVVSAIRQGSGVLLTDRLVLTCAHVVRSGSVHIAHPALPDRVRATVTWIDHQLDVALLEATEPVRRVPPARLGLLDTREAIPGCEITGFPRVQRYGRDQRLEVDQYTATVLPMAGRVRDLLVCELDGPPPAGHDDGPPALSGLSGGPVFVGDVLLGIARQVPLRREGRRVECVPLGPVLAAEAFAPAYRRTGAVPRVERVHGSFPRDHRYEAEYAQALGIAYRRTKVFGLDELSRHASEWDLDTAYLSLEAQAPASSARTGGAAPPLPQRIDTLLIDRPRVLLRGEAGAGKTTLLWWLAAHASARTLDDHLAPLNGLVPFVVPLRTLRARGGTFPGPAELSGAASLVLDTAPEGWAGRVLESGRALLLVDGLDEVPAEDREQAHDWLSQLLRRYPQTRCVATVRPLAVEPDWLRTEGFAELRLLPMRNEDIQAFVASWHRAARLSEDGGAERLDELEGDLSRQFDQNPALRDLARTPLLCAVICALHRRRDGFLPETRWKLYRSALDMLLGHRDHRRRIGDPEGVELDIEEHTQLLQRIAVWLVREGQSEFTREQALRQLTRGLAGMERVSAQGPAAKILTHLLNRSGLLQEHGDDTYQFIHRTFQDYLAAKELIEDDHLNELLRHADEEAWQDVILLAAGHCGRRELGLLVSGLLDAGLGHGEGTVDRTGLHVLAGLCAQHAAWLDSAVRDRVRQSTAALFPPVDEDQAAALARLGETALEFLPHPGSLSSDAPSARCTVQLLGMIGGRAAVPHARAWAEEHPELGPEFINFWDNFPLDVYVSEVLESCRLAGEFVPVSRGHLGYLSRLTDIDQLLVTGDVPETELGSAVEAHRLTRLAFGDNRLIADLGALASAVPSLAFLHFSRCSAIEDFGPLVDFPELESLSLRHCGTARLDALPALPRVLFLGLHEDRPVSLGGLSSWEALTSLAVSRLTSFADAAAELRDHGGVIMLRLADPPSAADCETVGPLPSVEHLVLDTHGDAESLALLRHPFPALRTLRLNAETGHPGGDLTPLHSSWPGLQVTVTADEEGAAPDRP